MLQNKVVVLHEYGAPSHYRALKYLLNKNEIKIEFREFGIGKKLAKSIIRFDIQLFKKQFINLGFLCLLAFTKNKKIVLGIAPYDYRLVFLLFLLRNHELYYHTSHPYWGDNAAFPHTLFYSNYLVRVWDIFLNQKIQHIFCATELTKENLIKYKNVDQNKISVVYHSFDKTIYFPERSADNFTKLKFIFVGRLTQEKGVDRILAFFSQRNDIFLTIVGDGDMRSLVQQFEKINSNIEYKGYISDQQELAKIYREHHFLLLPSIKLPTFVELFGMVVIEAMACGLVPICTKHPGPLEIIVNNFDGYLMDEINIENDIESIILNFNSEKYLLIRANSIKKANEFILEKISDRWFAILKNG